MKLVAIIPAYNEESTIKDVIKAISSFVDEILVINDGSKDRTTDIAKNSGATVTDNIFIRGLGKTIKRGANIVVQIDADVHSGESDKH